MGEKITKLVFIVVCFVLFVATDRPESYGYSVTQCGWKFHVMYNFYHVSWLHLVLNCITLWMLNTAFARWRVWFVWAVAFISSFIASYLSVMNEPTIGASGIIMGIVGLLSADILFTCKWKTSVFYFSAMAVMFFIQSPIQHANWMVHVWAVVIGCAMGSVLYITVWVGKKYLKWVYSTFR